MIFKQYLLGLSTLEHKEASFDHHRNKLLGNSFNYCSFSLLAVAHGNAFATTSNAAIPPPTILSPIVFGVFQADNNVGRVRLLALHNYLCYQWWFVS